MIDIDSFGFPQYYPDLASTPCHDDLNLRRGVREGGGQGPPSSIGPRSGTRAQTPPAGFWGGNNFPCGSDADRDTVSFGLKLNGQPCMMIATYTGADTPGVLDIEGFVTRDGGIVGGIRAINTTRHYN